MIALKKVKSSLILTASAFLLSTGFVSYSGHVPVHKPHAHTKSHAHVARKHANSRIARVRLAALKKKHAHRRRVALARNARSAAHEIYASAMALASQLLHTRRLYGAPYRNECVAAVQAVLRHAGMRQIANGHGQLHLAVPSFIPALLHSGYTKTHKPIPGDIVELAALRPGTGSHVGICTDTGCRTMISNSSTHGTFSWGYRDGQTTLAQNAAYGTGQPRYYHHV
jgi:hypothetical protein